MPSQSREKQLLKIRENRSHTQLFFFFLDGSVISVFVAPGESRMKERKRKSKREKEKETILKTAVAVSSYGHSLYVTILHSDLSPFVVAL